MCSSDLRELGINDHGALPCFDLGEYHPLISDRQDFLKMSTHTKFFLLRDFVDYYLASMEGERAGKRRFNGMSHSTLKVSYVTSLLLTLPPISLGAGSQKIGNKDKNDLCNSVLNLASDLMSFGFFATKEKVQHLCKPLIDVLDGREDKIVETVRAVVRGTPASTCLSARC